MSESNELDEYGTGLFESYNYEHYLAINPKLTKKMYEYLRVNGSLWRVRFGKHCRIQWTDEVLERVWWRNLEDDNNNRYLEYNFNDRFTKPNCDNTDED